MAINFKCTQCGKPISVPDKMAGKTGRCPACKSPLTVPTGGAAGGGGAKTRLVPDTDPRVAAKKKAAAGAAVAPARKKKPEPEAYPSDGDQTVIDVNMLSAKRAIIDEEPDAFDVPPLVDDDDDDLPVPDVEELSDAIAEDEADEGAGTKPSAADVLERAKARAAERRGEAADGKGARGRRFEPAEKKKGGGFMWAVFGMLLAVVHTAAAVLLGVWLSAAYMKTPKDFEFMATPVEILGVKDTIAPRNAGDSNTGNGAKPSDKVSDETGNESGDDSGDASTDADGDTNE